jgi:hypothetical protein
MLLCSSTTTRRSGHECAQTSREAVMRGLVRRAAGMAAGAAMLAMGLVGAGATVAWAATAPPGRD